MSDCLEVLFVSDSSGKQKTATCFNPNVGTTLITYKGNAAPRNCVSIIGKDYLLAADVNKPILNVWPLNHQEPLHELKMVLSGKPSALCVSPNGHYCVVGIDAKIFVWQISSGLLLNVITKHFHDINKIVFTNDSSYFITAGEDGLVLVWKLTDVIAQQYGEIFKPSSSQLPPVYSFSHHSLAVSDIFVGSGNLNSRLYTVSIDQTCKIYALSNGELLLSVAFDYELVSVTVNEIETELFVGTSKGKIQMFHLDPYPRNLQHHAIEDINKSNTFEGHTKAVTCLATSFDGFTLASGSDDEKVFLWNVPSRQLIRSFDMRGAVSSVFFYFASSNIFSSKFKPQLVVSKFERSSNVEPKNMVVNVWVHENLKPLKLSEEFESVERNEAEEKLEKEETLEDEDLKKLMQEVVKLKEANKQLYQFAMEKIIKNPFTCGIVSANGDGKRNEEPMEM